MTRETDDVRRERLKAALRDNLKRRKTQARARTDIKAATDRPVRPERDES